MKEEGCELEVVWKSLLPPVMRPNSHKARTQYATMVRRFEDSLSATKLIIGTSHGRLYTLNLSECKLTSEADYSLAAQPALRSHTSTEDAFVEIYPARQQSKTNVLESKIIDVIIG